VSLLRSHARRTHRLYCLDGRGVWGVSTFAALDADGPTSREGILGGRLATYAFVHATTVTAALDAGFELLPTFRRPHYTVRLAEDTTEEVARLLAVLGTPEDNPYNRGGESPSGKG